MNYFIDFFEGVKNFLFLSSSDSDEDRAKKILWYTFFGSILMISLVSYIIFVSLSFSGKGVKVPYMEGDNIYVALRKMSDKNLSAGVIPRYSDDIPEGIVMRQDITQGSFVKVGRRINLTVSMGKKENSLPDFTGMNLFDVAGLIDSMYPDGRVPYKVEERIYEFSDTVDRGLVIRQEPADGTPVTSVKSVKLWISNGMKTMASHTVGDYAEMKLYEALDDAASKEMNVTVTFTETNRRNEHYKVTGQNILPGTLVSETVRYGEVLNISSNVFIEQRDNMVKGNFFVELPRRNIPYLFTIERTEQGVREGEEIFRMTTKGGFTFTLPYSIRRFHSLEAKIGGEVLRTVTAE